MRLVLLLVLALAGCQDTDVSRAVGARCDVSAECDDRCLAPSDDWPDGFCTLTCDVDDDCPDDTACIADSGGGVCAFRCAFDADCRFLGEAYACKERNANAETAPPVMVCRGT